MGAMGGVPDGASLREMLMRILMERSKAWYPVPNYRQGKICHGLRERMISDWLLLLGTAATLSFALTAAVRHYAITRDLLDIPNARSSHSLPTPRGGGVAIVFTFLLAAGLGWRQGALSVDLFYGLFSAGGLVALVGFLDDHGHIAARWRLLAHFSAAATALYWLNGMPALDMGVAHVNSLLILNALGMLYLVWVLNLYNFMDGIDGLAALQAITTCLSACALYGLAGNVELMAAPALLAMAVSGFLVWNFPPAKIFMGDAGSGFLGLVLGVMAIQAASTLSDYFWVWCILMGAFIVDATFTLLRRCLNGSKVYEAHRTHAYQYAARRTGSHLTVTLGVALINIFWLLPVAAAVLFWKLNGIMGVVVSYVPLILLAIHYQAGKKEALRAGELP
jgi:Fuc2NAc and GlcNAc transferase